MIFTDVWEHDFILMSGSDISMSDDDVSTDCDCACPVLKRSYVSQNLAKQSIPWKIHPELCFLRLTKDASLAYIHSSLSGVVVNNPLRNWLEEHKGSNFSVSSEKLQNPIQRCIELGLMIDTDVPLIPPDPDTLVAWMHVTNACNLRCSYCYLKKTDEAMSTETGFAAIQAIVRSSKAHNYQRLKLKYAGGEASLNLSLVQKLHIYAQELANSQNLSYKGVMLSNGVGLTRYNLQMIKEFNLGLMISLDGISNVHDKQRFFENGRGSFGSVAHTIERAISTGLSPVISITVTGQNVASLAVTLEWVLERHLPFSINFYRENSHSQFASILQLEEEQLINGMLAAYQVVEEFLPKRCLLSALIDRANLQAAHNSPCGVGDNYLVIDQNGGITKCQMDIENPITSIHALDPLSIIRADTIGIRHIPVEQREVCCYCDWRHWCAGGCPVTTLQVTGRSDIQSPNCRIYKALFPELLRLEGLRILKYGTPEVWQRCRDLR